MKFPGDAWEGAVLEKWFLEEAQNFSFRGPECIDIGGRPYQILVRHYST